MIKRCNDFGAGGVSRGHRRAGRRPGHQPGRRAEKVRRSGRHGAGHLRIPGAHGRGAWPPRTWTPSSRSPTRRTWRPRRWPQVTEEPARAHALARRHHRGREPRVPREQRRAEACGGGRARAGRRELRRKRLRPRFRGDKRADRPRGGRRVRRRLAGSVPRGAHGRHQPRLEQGPRGALRLHHRRGHGAHALRRHPPAHPGARHGGEAAGARRQDHARSQACPGASTRIFRPTTPTPAPTWPCSIPWRSSWPPASSGRTCTSPSKSTSRSCARIPSAGASPWRRCSARSWPRSISGWRAIGGKDSMSGSFEDLDVPPTLVSFATAIGGIDRVTSPELKEAGDNLIWVSFEDALASSICADLRRGGVPHRCGCRAGVRERAPTAAWPRRW